MELNPIYEYSDFRAYLRDWFAWRRQSQAKFTKAEVARLLGLPNSRSYFSDVLAGKELSETFLERMVLVLDIDADQCRFFRALVRFQQARTTQARKEAATLLLEQTRTPRTILDHSREEFFRHWWYGAVRALLDTGDFGDQPERIATSLVPPISPDQARLALDCLSDLGLIHRNSLGFWKPTDRAISSPDCMRDALILGLQVQQLDLLRGSILHSRTDRRMVATNIVSVSPEGYTLLLDRLEQIRSEVRAIVHNDAHQAQSVCQVVIALSPLTHLPEATDN